MSEPSQRATRVEEIAPGLLHWSVEDERIGSRSEAYALALEEGTVAIDPLPLGERAVHRLGTVVAVVISIQSHQRSAWRLRERFGARVHAPAAAEGLDEEPDAWYGDRARLPGGLRAIHAPGPCAASYALLVDRPPHARVVFVGDLLVRGTRGPLGFVPDEYQDDPRRTRTSVRKLAKLDVGIVCPGHGAPIRTRGASAIASALARDARAGSAT